MQVVSGGFRLLKKPRTAAWRSLAISVLALAFPATAVAAGSAPTPSTTSASTRASGAPARAAHARLGRSVLALGSGYDSPDGSRLVQVLQRDLEARGYPPGHVDGLYGPRTRHAVVAFQAAHGLEVDGVVGPQTWAALSEPVLILGPGAGDQAGGENVVRSLQRRLASTGDSPGPIDGRYGALTEGAVRRFQREHGLPVTGIAGPGTLALLAKPEPSARAANPLPQPPAPSATRSNRSSRPTGSTVAPAPRQRPARAARKVPEDQPTSRAREGCCGSSSWPVCSRWHWYSKRGCASLPAGTRPRAARPGPPLRKGRPATRHRRRSSRPLSQRRNGEHGAARREPNGTQHSHQRASRQSRGGWHRQRREPPAVSETRGRFPRAGTRPLALSTSACCSRAKGAWLKRMRPMVTPISVAMAPPPRTWVDCSKSKGR